MEVWFDPATNEVKAVYSHRYSGTVWQAAGWQNREFPGLEVPRDLIPGARVDLSGLVPVVTVSAPPPPLDPQAVRRETARQRLIAADVQAVLDPNARAILNALLTVLGLTR